MTRQRPTLRTERRLHRQGFALVAGVDEVGRGALAGPVTVGVVTVSQDTPAAPAGVFDSKALTSRQRREVEPAIRAWATELAVGHAHAGEIDALGIMAALGLATQRALAALQLAPDALVLDGSIDYTGAAMPVVTRVRADARCSSVAAASVLAKVARDDLMIALARDLPEYDWAANKGYGSSRHLAALTAHGPSTFHRISWRLPGTGESAEEPVRGTPAEETGLSSTGTSAPLPR